MSMHCEIEIKTNQGTVLFTNVDLEQGDYTKDGIRLRLSSYKGISKVNVAPNAVGLRVACVKYRISTGLRNLKHVIIPDCGRFYSTREQLVDFWGFSAKSLISHIRVPIFIFTGLDHSTSLAFGIIGLLYETEFRCLEPFYARALSAYTKRLTLEISRGTKDYPIPAEAVEEDGSITEYLYLRNHPLGSNQSWFSTLREFCMYEQDLYNLQLPYSEGVFDPLWCSWTDWHSDQVTEKVILDNVKLGVDLGIKNFIIDDGWFGPGLDSSLDVTLNIGDWEVDPAKISDLSQLSRKIRELGGRSIIWCAPHAVGEGAKCRQERMPYLCRDAQDQLVFTKNRFNVLCVRNAEAREIMADICVKLAVEYETDGAKYDLFNCIPDIICCSKEHDHDTESNIVGLAKLFALIWQKLHKVKPGYIIELKQNYGGLFLAQYGSMMRAGDTPYNSEGNYLRTAFVQSYTPFAVNDYQTITNYDCPQAAAMMIIKMLAVGIPAYSMDLTNLKREHLQVLSNYHQWYLQKLELFKHFRVPEDLDLRLWKLSSDQEELYFVVDNLDRVKVDGSKNFTLLNGTKQEELLLEAAGGIYQLTYIDCTGIEINTEHVSLNGLTAVKFPAGGRIEAQIQRR